MRNPIELFKRIRKRNYIQRSYTGKYAFVGIGNHSIHNLYPVLDYLNVDLKYIVTRTEETAELINQNYYPVIGITDYNMVLDDPEIKGVFISANPQDHCMLTKKALLKKKNVFVEKPLCFSLADLIDVDNIVKDTGKVCLVGLQKRYSSCSVLLKKKLAKEKIISYNYTFGVGGYPEGDALWDIFIHPVDLVQFLFGDYEIVSCRKTERSKGANTILMQTKHDDSIGSVEMSTQYAWNNPIEELSINTYKGVYKMKNHQELIYIPKPLSVMSVPVDKIIPATPVKEMLFDANNFLPVFYNNQLVSQGYFGEIKTFLDLCENKKAENLSSPELLIKSYSIMEMLKK